MTAAYKLIQPVNSHCELAYGRLHKFMIACIIEQRAIVTVTMPEKWHKAAVSKHQAWRPCFYLSPKGQCCCCLLGTLLSHLNDRQMAFRNAICRFFHYVKLARFSAHPQNTCITIQQTLCQTIQSQIY